jgi:hypothetical protein
MCQVVRRGFRCGRTPTSGPLAYCADAPLQRVADRSAAASKWHRLRDSPGTIQLRRFGSARPGLGPHPQPSCNPPQPCLARNRPSSVGSPSNAPQVIEIQQGPSSFQRRIPTGGESGIRTHGTLTGTPDFESGTFGLSVISPPRTMPNRKAPVNQPLARRQQDVVALSFHPLGACAGTADRRVSVSG